MSKLRLKDKFKKAKNAFIEGWNEPQGSDKYETNEVFDIKKGLSYLINGVEVELLIKNFSNTYVYPIGDYSLDFKKKMYLKIYNDYLELSKGNECLLFKYNDIELIRKSDNIIKLNVEGYIAFLTFNPPTELASLLYKVIYLTGKGPFNKNEILNELEINNNVEDRMKILQKEYKDISFMTEKNIRQIAETYTSNNRD